MRFIMADPRIIDIQLDERTILWRNADVEQERRIAIFDLLEDNHFAPQRAHPDGYAGPYKVVLRVEEGRLVQVGRARGTRYMPTDMANPDEIVVERSEEGASAE